jgi:HEAT repeat protein
MMSDSVDRVNKDIDSLVQDLNSYHWQTRFHARESLVAIGRPAVASLTKALFDPRRQVRWEAAKALGEIADPAAAPALVKTLEDREDDIRWLAAEGLIALEKEGLIPLLQALVHHSDSEWLRAGAHHVLRKQVDVNVMDIVEPVLAALEDIEPSIQVPPAAQRALDALTGPVIRHHDPKVPVMDWDPGLLH